LLKHLAFDSESHSHSELLMDLAFDSESLKHLAFDSESHSHSELLTDLA